MPQKASALCHKSATGAFAAGRVGCEGWRRRVIRANMKTMAITGQIKCSNIAEQISYCEIVHITAWSSWLQQSSETEAHNSFES